MRVGLGSLVKHRRIALNLSRSILSFNARVDYYLLTRLENNLLKRVPTPDTLKRLADALDLPEAALLAAAGYEVAADEVMEGNRLDLVAAVCHE